MAKIRFEAIVPKDKFDFEIFQREVAETMRKVNKPEIKKIFDGTVDGWDNKPFFRGTMKSIRGKSVRLLVQPTGKNADQYRLVSLGSPPHDIPARSGGMLVFPRGYRSATKPGSLSSQRKARFGPIVQTPSVDHPGFKGREFDVQIAEKYDPRFQETMARAIERAGAKQNNAMKS